MPLASGRCGCHTFGSLAADGNVGGGGAMPRTIAATRKGKPRADRPSIVDWVSVVVRTSSPAVRHGEGQVLVGEPSVRLAAGPRVWSTTAYAARNAPPPTAGCRGRGGPAAPPSSVACPCGGRLSRGGRRPSLASTRGMSWPRSPVSMGGTSRTSLSGVPLTASTRRSPPTCSSRRSTGSSRAASTSAGC